MIILLYALTALSYAGLGLLSWCAYRRRTGSPAVGCAGCSRRLLHAGILAVLMLHGTLLHQTVFRADSMHFGFAYALSAMLWLSAGIYWIERFFFPIDGLCLLIMPAASAASLAPLIFADNRVLLFAADPIFKLHFTIANMAYGLFALAALHALLMLCVERRLHPQPAGACKVSDGLARWLDALPPLLTLEKLLFRLIAAGFALLTLTLITGVLFSEALLGQAAKFDHKTVFAVVSWLMFAALLVGRRLYGWRGKTALRWVLASFVALLLAYIGSRFILATFWHRFWQS